jgi:hypothetical protein
MDDIDRLSNYIWSRGYDTRIDYDRSELIVARKGASFQIEYEIDVSKIGEYEFLGDVLIEEYERQIKLRALGLGNDDELPDEDDDE